MLNHTIPKTVPTVWRRLWERLFSHEKEICHGGEHAFWKPSQPAKEVPAGADYLAQPESRSSKQFAAFTAPSPGGGDQDHREGKPPEFCYDEDNRRKGPGGAAISFAGLPDNLKRKVAELEMRCANMAREMKKKDKAKLLQWTDS
jgi:hypothetical protein